MNYIYWVADEVTGLTGSSVGLPPSGASLDADESEDSDGAKLIKLFDSTSLCLVQNKLSNWLLDDDSVLFCSIKSDALDF